MPCTLRTHRPRLLVLALVGLMVATATNIPAGTRFVPQYSFSANDGFNDPVLGANRRTALEFSLALWSTWLVPTYATEVITVAVGLLPQPGGTLAEGGPADIYRAGSQLNRVTPLANDFYGRDTNPGQPEIYVDFDLNTNFYLGLDGRPGTNEYDFVTVALHEVGHGLGILDIINRQTGGYFRDDGPSVYELFLAQTAGTYTPLISMTDAERLAALGSGDLWWTGPAASAANGGQPIRIHAPPLAADGSGVSHLPPDSGSLWSPILGKGEATHSLTAIERGLFTDLGYTVATHPPALLFKPTCDTNGFCFTFQTAPGVSYVIEFKAAFQDATWTALPGPPLVGDGTAQMVRDPAGLAAQRFYRIKSQ